MDVDVRKTTSSVKIAQLGLLVVCVLLFTWQHFPFFLAGQGIWDRVLGSIKNPSINRAINIIENGHHPLMNLDNFFFLLVRLSGFFAIYSVGFVFLFSFSIFSGRRIPLWAEISLFVIALFTHVFYFEIPQGIFLYPGAYHAFSFLGLTSVTWLAWNVWLFFTEEMPEFRALPISLLTGILVFSEVLSFLII